MEFVELLCKSKITLEVVNIDTDVMIYDRITPVTIFSSTVLPLV